MPPHTPTPLGWTRQPKFIVIKIDSRRIEDLRDESYKPSATRRTHKNNHPISDWTRLILGVLAWAVGHRLRLGSPSCRFFLGSVSTASRDPQ